MSNEFRGLLGLGFDTRSGLESKFNQFKQNIELTENQKSQIITSHTNLRKELEKLSYVQSTFLTGSYKKNTMIRPPYDVDIFVVLNQDQATLQPQSILDKLKRDISNISTYSKSTIRQDRPCVVVDLNHCMFEITPALSQLGILSLGYKIPQKGLYSLNWEYIEDPNSLAKRLSQRNVELGNKLIPLIKMMKKCKNHNKIKNIKSFEMEEKAIQRLSSIFSFRTGVQELLKIYEWSDNSKQNYHQWLQNLSDNDFASHCRSTLFGQEFPQ